MMLEKLNSVQDIKKINSKDLPVLSEEIRSLIVSTVAQNGGHLSSNLGVVEMTIALLRAFDPDEDQIIWDVGHQCYAYKILTGRRDQFSSLRQTNGLSGFLRTEESAYDYFNSGHASSALSLALGLARARDFHHQSHQVIAVVGDGALTGGLSYEALNEMGGSDTKVVIVLNDNGMSISRNVGALSNYLTYLRLSKGWQRTKRVVAGVLKKIPLVGNVLHDVFQRGKNRIRNFFVKDKFFSALNIRYLGPIDGHNIPAMERIFQKVAQQDESVVIHLMTNKGEGYDLAKEHPDLFHGASPFDVETGEALYPEKTVFGKLACDILIEKTKEDEPIVCITAAMSSGTGMEGYKTAFPKRFFDVGIAEEHAVTLAAGLAKGGMRPVVAIYDTFLQRAYDELLEDVCAQKLPVLFLIDRAELACADGLSHHGIFGFSYLNTMPELTILSPWCADELSDMISWALRQKLPVAVRYSKQIFSLPCEYKKSSFLPGKWTVIEEGQDACLIVFGRIAETALEVRKILQAENKTLSVVYASSPNCPDAALLQHLNEEKIPYFTLEENVLRGGFGSFIAAWTGQHGQMPPKTIFALPDRFPDHGDRKQLLAVCGLSPEKLAEKIKEYLR